MKKIDFAIDEFMNYCESKDLSQKTMMSYEQTLRFFSKYLKEEKKIEDVTKVTEKNIREYIIYTNTQIMLEVVKTNSYNNWIRNFPVEEIPNKEEYIIWEDIDFNKPISIYIRYVCKDGMDIRNV